MQPPTTKIHTSPYWKEINVIVSVPYMMKVMYENKYWQSEAKLWFVWFH
jgi:hypothetical protein